MVLLAPACVSRSDSDAGAPEHGKSGSALTDEQNGSGKAQGNTGTSSGTSAGDAPGGENAGGAGRSTRSGRSIDDHRDLGVNTRLYLSAQVPKLVVEVDAVKGFEPSQTALGTLKARLNTIVDKPGGVQVLPVETFADGHDQWTASDLAGAEKRYRNHWSTRDAIVLYLLCVDGSFAETEDALGAAYESSAFAVFEEQVREAATPLVSVDAIEKAVVVHEMGHVLALVNIGYRSPRDHEDTQHENHSNNPNSVMYWAVDNIGVANLLVGRTTPPMDFDADDRADLEDLKDGRLRVG